MSLPDPLSQQAANPAGEDEIVLVGAGDLGVRTGELLRGAGAGVTGWRRRPERLPAGWRGRAVDVTDAAAVPDLEPAVTGVLVALSAGERTAQRYREVYLEGLRTTLDRVERAVERLGRAPRIVLVSSSAVHGDAQGWITENSPLTPATATAEVLARCEEELRARARDAGLTASILRLSGIYGPGRGSTVRRILDGSIGERTADRSPDPWRISNRIHVHDAARAAATLLRTTTPLPEVVLGVDRLPVPLGAVHNWIARRAGVDLPWPDADPELPAPGDRCDDQLWPGTAAHGRALDCSGIEHLLGTLDHPDFRAGYGSLPELSPEPPA